MLYTELVSVSHVLHILVMMISRESAVSPMNGNGSSSASFSSAAIDMPESSEKVHPPIMAVHIVTVMLAAVVIVMIQVVGAVRDREV